MLLQVFRTILSWREDFLSPAGKIESGESGNKSFCTQLLLFCPKKSRIRLLIIFFFRLTGGPVGGSIESGYKWDGNTYFCSRLYIMGLQRWPQRSSQFSLFSSKREFTSHLRNGRLHCLWQAGTLDGQTSNRFGASSSHKHSQLISVTNTLYERRMKSGFPLLLQGLNRSDRRDRWREHVLASDKALLWGPSWGVLILTGGNLMTPQGAGHQLWEAL